MSKPDFVVVRETQVIHETDSLAVAAAFAGDVYGSAVYERVEIADGDEAFNPLADEMPRTRKGGAA